MLNVMELLLLIYLKQKSGLHFIIWPTIKSVISLEIDEFPYILSEIKAYVLLSICS